MKFLICLISIMNLTFSLVASAQPLSWKQAKGTRIQRILVTGLTKTNREVVERELLLKVGDRVDADSLRRSVQRLKNLEIFSQVKIKFHRANPRLRASTSDGVYTRESVLEIKLSEKWTMIPIAKFGGGGGQSFFTLGVYDPNAFGTYLELGGQYENLGGKHSGVVWFRNPRLFGERLKYSVDLWSRARIRNLYGDSASDLQGSFVNRRQRIVNALDWELNDHLTVGGVLEFSNHTNSEKVGAISLSDELTYLSPELNVTLGKLNHDLDIIEGIETRLSLTNHISLGNGSDYRAFAWKTRALKRVFGRSNIGAQLNFGLSDASEVSDLFYIGGLGEVRGYQDGQFRGKSYLQGNFEFRTPSIDTSSFILQHVVFLDTVRVGESLEDLFDASTFATVGTGVRFILPKIYRLNIRVDYAHSIGPNLTSGISFGLQQFF